MLCPIVLVAKAKDRTEREEVAHPVDSVFRWCNQAGSRLAAPRVIPALGVTRT